MARLCDIHAGNKKHMFQYLLEIRRLINLDTDGRLVLKRIFDKRFVKRNNRVEVIQDSTECQAMCVGL
jgi:hypothetical protein